MKQQANFDAVIGMTLLFPSEIEAEMRSLQTCNDCDFEPRFHHLLQGVEKGFRESELDTTDPRHLVNIHAEILGILNHAHARAISSDVYFARKIVHILVSRFPRRRTMN